MDSIICFSPFQQITEIKLLSTSHWHVPTGVFSEVIYLHTNLHNTFIIWQGWVYKLGWLRFLMILKSKGFGFQNCSFSQIHLFCNWLDVNWNKICACTNDNFVWTSEPFKSPHYTVTRALIEVGLFLFRLWPFGVRLIRFWRHLSTMKKRASHLAFLCFENSSRMTFRWTTFSRTDLLVRYHRPLQGKVRANFTPNTK